MLLLFNNLCLGRCHFFSRLLWRWCWRLRWLLGHLHHLRLLHHATAIVHIHRLHRSHRHAWLLHHHAWLLHHHAGLLHHHLLLLLHHHGIHHRIIPLHHRLHARLHARLHHTHLRIWVNSTRFNCGITISCFKLLHFLYFFNNYNVQLFKIKIDNYVILFQLIYH